VKSSAPFPIKSLQSPHCLPLQWMLDYLLLQYAPRTVHTELDYKVCCKDPIPSMLLETCGCYGGATLVKRNYLNPLPLSSSSMTKLDDESKIQNERTGATLLKVSPN